MFVYKKPDVGAAFGRPFVFCPIFLSRPSFGSLHYPTLIFIIKIIDFYLKIVV